MKTTLELPDELMRAVKLRAAATDRKLKDVVAEALAVGLAAANKPVSRKAAARRGGRAARHPHKQAKSAPLDPALEALFAAGDAMKAAGVDFEEWARHSRDVWR
jgi:plasmid stability protein